MKDPQPSPSRRTLNKFGKPSRTLIILIVVNYYCKNGCSQRESNPQLALRRRLLYPFNYENKCRIFKLFSSFGSGCHIYEFNHSCDELPVFYSRQRLPCIQIFPLKRLPIAGSPNKSPSLMQISNTISLHSIFIA